MFTYVDIAFNSRDIAAKMLTNFRSLFNVNMAPSCFILISLLNGISTFVG